MKYLGPRACEEALKSDSLHVLRVSPAAWGRTRGLREMARASGASVHREPTESLDRRSDGQRHQGVLGEGSGIRYSDLAEILEAEHARGKHGLILALDGITDPYNFGAVLRSAAAANVDAVIFPQRRSAQANETVIRASAGAAAHVPLVRAVNLGRAIDELKKAGVRILGMSASAEDSQNYLDEQFNAASAIVLGSEGEGLRLKIRERCDAMLNIEMPGRIGSLNVSVAAAVVLFRALAMRKKNL